MMKREITCIVCPRGCRMTADIQGETITVTGHTCPKGEEYAINECLHPMRTVTATIRVANRKDTMVSVKTEVPVPKEHMMDVMARLRAITVDAAQHAIYLPNGALTLEQTAAVTDRRFVAVHFHDAVVNFAGMKR